MTDYKMLCAQLAALTEGVDERISNLANAAALLYHTLPDLNWAGFYLLRRGALRLGPFLGRPACVRIPLDRGVCGTAAARGETLLVPDVHAFPGHIACDAASASELVIPLQVGGALYGVLDLDSPKKGRFTEADRTGLEAFARALETALERGE
ncbi:MAG: GAF domain-containing protein [Oscillospiraceae bacterium]|nr:GAF domain-containing protein [Oscillospiraceae bacterium]